MTACSMMQNGTWPASAARPAEADESCTKSPCRHMLALDAVVLASIFIILAVLPALCGVCLLLPLLAVLLPWALPLLGGPEDCLED